MKPSRYMDSRLDRVDMLNDLMSIQTPEYRSAIEKKKKKGGKGDKSGSGSGGGLFGLASTAITFRADGGPRQPSVLGIIHPSDGHPMQEHCPDFNWFRPLTFNNNTWTLYWPELII